SSATSRSAAASTLSGAVFCRNSCTMSTGFFILIAFCWKLISRSRLRHLSDEAVIASRYSYGADRTSVLAGMRQPELALLLGHVLPLLHLLSGLLGPGVALDHRAVLRHQFAVDCSPFGGIRAIPG